MIKDSGSLSSSGVSNNDNDTGSIISGGTVDTWCSGTSSFSLDESSSSSTKYNIDHCKDFHVGPKLFAEKFQINLNGEGKFVAKVTEKLIGQVEFNGKSTIGDSLSFKKKRRLRNASLCAIWLTIWLAAVTCVVIVVLERENIFIFSHAPEPHQVTTPQVPFTTTWPEPTTTHVTSTVTTSNPTTYQPATSTSTTTESTKTTKNIFPILASRDSWHGLQPPRSAARNRTAVRTIIVDNLQSERCSGEANCSKILQKFENQTNKALNYNFLIDDSGIVYEARGWYYASDEQTNFSVDLIKFGFIGSYEDSHLTESQKTALSSFISQYWSDFTGTPLIKAQCCRDIDDEKGPDINVSCDLYETEKFLLDTECISEVKNCDNRSWIWRYFTSNEFTCDQSSIFNYVTSIL